MSEIKEDILKNVIESMKLDLYVESKISEMHVCFLCGRIGYKNLPMKKIGNKWICIDCLRELKEALDSLEEWEQEITLRQEIKKQIEKEFGGD
ncbi:hypothetical protein AciM339_0491 [Aciduliprofundum sp. MAR08-339]|uniref:hypothetical protein n=1 Tax=Aciduliprofundum sp. (strain MAR08-339) TaxID=673860 RepID=UPI0002A4B4F5|nr:hypothetical protein AciM339_0491 [Aciduliprofundum sp. MAR08-339]